MNVKKACSSIVIIGLLVALTSCSENPSTFHVMYSNESGSNYIITALFVKTSTGSWSSSYIPAGQSVPPSQYFEFDIPLRMGSDIEYYITVQDGLANSTNLTLDDQGDVLIIRQWAEQYRHQYITVQPSAGNPVVTGHGGDVWSTPADSSYTKVSWQ